MELVPGIFAMVVYLYFILYFGLFMVFILPGIYASYIIEFAGVMPGIPAIYNIDLPPLEEEMSTQKIATALIIDVCLLLAFAIPHSLMAQDSIKKMHGIPENWERAVYCLQSTLLIHSQMHFWRNFGGSWTLWDVSDSILACRALAGVFLFGVIFLLSATFALDHFHLAGLSQGFGIDINAALGLSPSTKRSGVSMRAHYSFVAHPIMTGDVSSLINLSYCFI